MIVLQSTSAQKSTGYLFPLDSGNLIREKFALRAQDSPLFLGASTMQPCRMRARSLREAAKYIADPDRLAQVLRRPRKLVDNWLPVSIPDNLAHVFWGGVSVDAGRALLRSRLARLCARLDACLNERPVVVENGPCREVTVFGRVGYNVDFVSRRVSAVRIYANGSRQSLGLEVELMQPLTTAYWLNWVLEDLGLGLAVSQSQLSLFGTSKQAREHDEWLIATAYRLLKKDPRFEWLRRVALPRALGLPSDILALALQARHADRVGCVPTTTFNVVWQHEAAFRRVAAENPQMLKLLELFLWEKKLPLAADPVAEMRDYFRVQGFNDMAWRYVHKYGSRLFRMVWRMAANKSQLDACVHYLRELAAAGFPPPPTRALAAAWFRCFINRREDRVRFVRGWSLVDATVIRTVLLEASHRCGTSEYAQYVSEAVNVLHWAMDTNLSLGAQQARLGWNWLHRRWLVYCERRVRKARAAGVSWPSCLRRMTIGHFEVVPIESGEGLVDEALAMNNCVDTFVEACKAGGIRIFSVRGSSSGTRIATLAIDSSGILWGGYQVKRFANRPAGRELEQLMMEVARLYTERCDSALARPS